MEYPLPHRFAYDTGLSLEAVTQDSLYLSLIRATEAFVGAESIEVNPANANFAEETGASIHMGSIVPKLKINLMMSIAKLGVETDKLQAVRIKWTPIYIAFLDSLEAEDSKTTTQVEDILELQHDITNKDTYPLHNNGTHLTGSSHPLNTIGGTEVFGDWGLTTNNVQEYVNFDEDLLKQALSYYSNGGMLRKVLGKTHYVTLTRDRPYIFTSNNFTHPSVKRGNPYTYCGILVHLPSSTSGASGSYDQWAMADETTVIRHVNIRCIVSYDEWNPLFDQAGF